MFTIETYGTVISRFIILLLVEHDGQRAHRMITLADSTN